MRQQINLYQRARPIYMQISARSVLLANGILLAALLSIWTYGQFAVTRLQRQVELLQQQQQAQQNLMHSVSALYREKIDPATLQQQVAQLEQTLQDRQQALVLLRNRTPAAQQGFAGRLQALAHPHIDGVWLEGVALDGRPGIQSLRGRSLDPALVATYLRALGNEPALAGTRFTEVQILGSRYVDPKDVDTDSANRVNAVQPGNGVRFRVDNRLEIATQASAVAGSAT